MEDRLTSLLVENTAKIWWMKTTMQRLRYKKCWNNWSSRDLTWWMRGTSEASCSLSVMTYRYVLQMPFGIDVLEYLFFKCWHLMQDQFADIFTSYFTRFGQLWCSTLGIHKCAYHRWTKCNQKDTCIVIKCPWCPFCTRSFMMKWWFCILILQVFKETADQAEAWLAGKEAFLSNEDVGVRFPIIYLFLNYQKQWKRSDICFFF